MRELVVAASIKNAIARSDYCSSKKNGKEVVAANSVTVGLDFSPIELTRPTLTLEPRACFCPTERIGDIRRPKRPTQSVQLRDVTCCANRMWSAQSPS